MIFLVFHDCQSINFFISWDKSSGKIFLIFFHNSINFFNDTEDSSSFKKFIYSNKSDLYLCESDKFWYNIPLFNKNLLDRKCKYYGNLI